MKSAALLASLSLFAASGACAEDIRLRVAPADFIYLYDASVRRGYVDLMVQTIAVTREKGSPVELVGLRLEYLKNGAVRMRRSIDVASAIPDTAEFAGMLAGGFDTFLRLQILDPQGLEAFAGDGARLSTDLTLEAGETILSSGHYAALDFEPDAVAVVADYRRGAGKLRSVRLDLKVRRAESSIEYAFPLDGAWLMRGFPSVQSHHRWIPSNEFALDFFKIGAEAATHDGDPLVAEDNFGYGAAVKAAAAGEVVFVIGDATQDRAALSIQPGETRQAAIARIQPYTMGRIRADFRKALAGNVVIIRHEGSDGTVEYSSYGHLKAGSVRVRVGDRVARGEMIAEVGDTGDSAAVHLHFQVNEGPDPFFTRSKPVRFFDMQETFSGQDPGLFVRGPSADH